MNADLKAMLAQADDKADEWGRYFRRLSSAQSIKDDLPEVVEGISELLAPSLASGDAQAVGVMLCAAFKARAARIATRITYGCDAADMQSDDDAAAASALSGALNARLEQAASPGSVQ